MATASEVSTGLDAIADAIASQRGVVKKAVQNAAAASSALSALPGAYADVIATVQGYAGGNAAEDYAKAQLAALTSEFQALKTTSDGIAATSL